LDKADECVNAFVFYGLNEASAKSSPGFVSKVARITWIARTLPASINTLVQTASPLIAIIIASPASTTDARLILKEQVKVLLIRCDQRLLREITEKQANCVFTYVDISFQTERLSHFRKR
jgi:hypothetical protein